jgi:hypothetical protein
MPQINRTYRNIAIVLVIAALVDVVPGGGNASSTVLEFVYLAFFGAFVWVASRLYREHRTSLYGLGTRRRAIAYGAVGVIVVTLTGTDRLWHNAGAAGNIAWLVLLGGAGYALYSVFRSAREY